MVGFRFLNQTGVIMSRVLLPYVCTALWLSPCVLEVSNAANLPAGTVEFSHPRGIYNAAIRLTITAPPGQAIYYTLDGTAPSKATGLRYVKPLKIDKTTVVRATVGESNPETDAVYTHTYLFANQVWKQAAYPDGYVRSAISQRHGPSRPQDFDWAMDSELLTNDQDRAALLEALTDLPTLAVTIAVEDLNFLYKHHRSRGVKFERPASLELIYPKKETYESFPGFQIDCGIRMQGGMAVDQARKKSFRVLFKKKIWCGKIGVSDLRVRRAIMPRQPLVDLTHSSCVLVAT